MKDPRKLQGMFILFVEIYTMVDWHHNRAFQKWLQTDIKDFGGQDSLEKMPSVLPAGSARSAQALGDTAALGQQTDH